MEEILNSGPIIENPKKFSRSNYAQLVTHGLNNIVSLFVSTFLISYIYAISSNYILNIGLFYAFNYLAMGVVYFLLSTLIDKTNRVVFYRIAILIRTLFILSVVFVGKSLASYVILAGLLHGSSEAFYWASYNIMKNELVRKSLMKKYSTIQQVAEKSVCIVIPLILGSLIDAESFKTSAIIVLIVAVLEIIFSMLIVSHRPENSSFDFKGFIAKIKELDDKKSLIVDCIINGGVYGFYTIVSPMITIMVMYAFNSNFSLGVLTGVFAACSLIFVLILNKFTKTGKRSVLFIVSAFLPFISALLLVLNITKEMVIVFHASYTILSVVHIYTYDVSRNVVIKKLHMYDYIAEYQCAIECFMSFCRFSGFLVMVAVGLITANYGADAILLGAKIVTVLSTLSMTGINLRLLFYEKKLVKNNIS